MKIIRQLCRAILLLAALALLFRGWIYRQVVTYAAIGPRDPYTATDGQLIQYLETNAAATSNPDIADIMELSLALTARQLNFSTSSQVVDPNLLIHSKATHCVGYAAFFTTTCNYFLQQYHLSEVWQAKPQIGKLYFLGADLHQFFYTPFFKDHDFVTIENRRTGEVWAVDPSIRDYLYIDFVTLR